MTETDRQDIITPAAGLIIYCTDCGSDGELQVYNGAAWTNVVGGSASASPWPAGSVFCASGPTAIVEVTNPVTSKTWMDRNLGAIKVAASSGDIDSYGDLYQWGRAADGHQCRTSPLHNGGTLGLATTSAPNTDETWDGHFIITSGDYWLQTHNNFLWNTNDPTNANDPSPGKGVTDPCPIGYRVPTEAELNAERGSWTNAAIGSTNNAAGAFASPIKLPAAGFRFRTNGGLTSVGIEGNYWSSTMSGTLARRLQFGSGATMSVASPSFGKSVRCLKD
jgi:uncharacterized protein (TIGR02145 family)